MLKKPTYLVLVLFTVILILLSFLFVYERTKQAYLAVGISYGKIEQKQEIIDFFARKNIPACKELSVENTNKENVFIENKTDAILYLGNSAHQFSFCQW